jgi:hypothetical protein
MYYLMLPSELVGLTNRTEEMEKTVSNREMYLLHGELKGSTEDCFRSEYGSLMHNHNHYSMKRPSGLEEG